MNLDANILVLLAVALINAFTGFLAWRTHRKVLAQAKDIHTIELATNSMKDALVKATGDAAHAAGRVEGLAEARAVDNPKT